jgi:hypothetical protein
MVETIGLKGGCAIFLSAGKSATKSAWFLLPRHCVMAARGAIEKPHNGPIVSSSAVVLCSIASLTSYADTERLHCHERYSCNGHQSRHPTRYDIALIVSKGNAQSGDGLLALHFGRASVHSGNIGEVLDHIRNGQLRPRNQRHGQLEKLVQRQGLGHM